MSELTRIVAQLNQGFEGGAWSGPSLLEILDGVDARTAAAKPIEGAHSIWEIVVHLCAGQAIMLTRLAGQAPASTDDEHWWPPMPELTGANWYKTLETLKAQEAQLHEAIANFPENRLDEPLSSEGTTAYNNFHGHVQHNLYHAGQIVLLKKTGDADQS